MSVDSFRLTKKTLIKTHNTKVARAFHKEKGIPLTPGEKSARDSCIIRTKDSAPVISLKIHLFYDVFSNNDNIASIPQSWEVKPGDDRPQLVIIYRPKLKKFRRLGSYQVVVPHYKGDKTPVAPSFHKGNHYAVLVLKDNSQLHINSHSEEEALKVLGIFKRQIDPKYIINEPRVGKRKGKKLAQIEVVPIRADFYPHGKVNQKPFWTHSYPKL
jgi:hypothetical protein